MGYLHKGVCYSTIEQARQSACSAVATNWGSGGTYYSAYCGSNDFSVDQLVVMIKPSSGFPTSNISAYPPFPSCNFDGGSDLALSWLYAVLPVIVAIWGLKRLIKIFDTGAKED